MTYTLSAAKLAVNDKKVKADGVTLYLWNNQLYKVMIEFADGEKIALQDDKLLARALLDAETAKMGGRYIKRYYRDIYADSSEDKFHIYWGQPMAELRSIYDFTWDLSWRTIDFGHLYLAQQPKIGEAYLVAVFSNKKLYKVMLCFDLTKASDADKQLKRVDAVKQILTKKFGKPADYNDTVVMWTDKKAKVDAEEELELKDFMDNGIRRYAVKR